MRVIFLGGHQLQDFFSGQSWDSLQYNFLIKFIGLQSFCFWSFHGQITQSKISARPIY